MYSYSVANFFDNGKFDELLYQICLAEEFFMTLLLITELYFKQKLVNS